MNDQTIVDKDLSGLLSKYLTEDQLDAYIRTIAKEFLPQQPLRLTRTQNQLDKFFNENIQTQSVRIVSDTLITYVNEIVSAEKYIQFLLDFSKLVLTQGELNLAFEISNMTYILAKKQKGYEPYKAHSLILIGEYYAYQSNAKEAFAAIKAARAIYEALGDRNGMGRCEFLIGSIYTEQGDLNAGKVRMENCLTFIDHTTETILVAQVENNLGIINYLEGNLEAALTLYNKAYKKFDQMKDSRRVAELLVNKGMIYRKQNDAPGALEIFDKCSDIARVNGLAPTLNLCFINKAEIFLEKMQLDLAMKYSQKAMELSYLLNDKLSIADIHKLFGVIASKQNNFDLAENHLLTSIRLNRELSQELNAAESNYELGLLYKEKGKKKEAVSNLMCALKYFDKNSAKTTVEHIEAQLLELNN